MKLFHGSKSGIVGAIAPRSRAECDFGAGFYLGDSPVQPLTLVCHYPNPVFYSCEFDLSGLTTYSFSSRYEWAFYIAYCRGKCQPFAGTALYARIEGIGQNADVMVGRIANDRMFMVLNDFFDGQITDKAMISSLEVLNLGAQYVAKTAKACAQIQILDQRAVTPAECAALRIKSENQRNRALELTRQVYQKHRRDGYFFDEFFEISSIGRFPDE